MRGIIRSIQFKRDVKLAKKRGKDMAKLRELILCSRRNGRCRRATGIIP